MRITNPTLLRGYNRDLNRVMNLKNKSEHMITTTRRFSRASEDALSAAKALNVRKSQYYSEQHQENLKVAAKFYTEAETSLIQVSEQMALIRETIIAACNTTKDQEEYNIYSQQLETKARELCAIFNTDSAGRAIFGGESDNSLPFEIIDDSNGHAATVTYHGIPVNAMNDYTKFPYSDEVNVDIGLGMVVNQESHYVDPDSVLKISFNGPEVTGCGAERGVADIDLSSIKEDRAYSLYVYAGDVKQKIEFVGKGTQQENVDLINSKLKEAFQEEITFERNRPVMDKQGMISLRDKMGDAVEGGMVCVVNNPYPTSKHTSQLKIDNDSNYTDKYKLRLSELPEGKIFRVDVQVGNGQKRTIEFESGTDNVSDPNNPIFREDITVKNFQAALDKAFGFDKDGGSIVTISPDDPTKGVISSEGNTVKLFSRTDSSLIDLEGFKPGEQYSLRFTIGKVEKEITFTAGADKAANKAAIEAELNGFAKIDDDGNVTTDNDKYVIVEKVGQQTSYDEADISTTTPTPVTETDRLYLAKFENGTNYAMKVSIGGGTAKLVEFEAGKTASDTKKAIAEAIEEKFPDGTVKVTNMGEITYTDENGEKKTVTITEAADNELTEVNGVTANNDTVDLALTSGKIYSVSVKIGDGVRKDVHFTAGADKNATKTALETAIKNAFPEAFKQDGTVTPVLTISDDGKITYTNANVTNTAVSLAQAKDTGKPVSVELGEEKKYKIAPDSLKPGKEYSLKFIVGNQVENITVTAGATPKDTIDDFNAKLKTAFGTDGNGDALVYIDDTTGELISNEPAAISNNPAPVKVEDKVFERECVYSNNYIQLTLDAARALREGDIDYANGCIDRLVQSNEKLLVEIADLGCNEEFIDFNISRLTIRDENLAERQNDLEIIDPAKQITLWKQYEAMYNACLQMSSSVVPQSIFDYI